MNTISINPRYGGLVVDVLTTEENFDEAGYLAANADVAAAARDGRVTNGRQHFEAFGKSEGRRQSLVSAIEELRREKIARIEPLLHLDMPHVRRGTKYDFISEELRRATGISDTNAVSSNNYDGYGLALIDEFKDALILDCGAGRRSVYYPNVVNFEIVDYDTTDIIGVGESLPFNDCSFEAVISVAVLEHVRDPFKCAAEIVRVLKPGGKLLACAPFLAPLHGYPHHYYNMSHQGLRALFDRALMVDDQKVIDSILPIWTLTWIAKSWADGLSGSTRDEFLSMSMRELLAAPVNLIDRAFVRELSIDKNFELACGTLLFAHKPIRS
jgi:SAM-dependent methyltransferase